MRPRSGLWKFGAFQAVGAVTTLVSLPAMAGLDLLGVPYPVYSLLNYLAGLVAGFFLNFRFAFADQGASKGPAALRYTVGFLTLLALVQGLQWLIVEGAGAHRYVGVGIGMVIYAVAGYALSRHWIFAGPRR